MADNYEAWRITYQSSEQAARAAFAEMQRLAAALEAAREDTEPSHIRAVAKRNLRSLIKVGSSDKALMLACLEELS